MLDSSVILAIIFDEPGGADAIENMAGGIMSSVNFSEVLGKCIDQGADPNFAESHLRRLDIALHPFSASDARMTAALRPLTRHRGLSLGDRACLALAQRETLPVLTGDRQWADIDIGVDIRLIR